jgi:glycosyltransferase involved in cell wall biosynthesis
MHILFVAPRGPTGSHLPFVRREVHALRNAGHHVDLYAFDNSRYSLLYFCEQVSGLRAAVRRLRPEVVHARVGRSTALAAACAAGGLAPLVVSFRGTDVGRNTRYSALRSALGAAASQLAALFAAGVVCPSREMLGRVLARRWCASLVLPNGVDLNLFSPGERAAARERLGLRAEDRIVLFNCSGNPAFNDPDLAAQALDDARRRVGEVRLVLLDGSAPPEDLPHYMNGADCLLVTSRREARPTLVEEAMACNLPVVSAADGKRCPIALGMALAEVLRSPCRSAERGNALSVDSAAARLAGFYGEILGKGELGVGAAR